MKHMNIGGQKYNISACNAKNTLLFNLGNYFFSENTLFRDYYN